MPKGNFIETPEVVALKDSRTQKLLEQLNVDTTFLDPKLPKGFFSNSQYNSWLICGKAYEFKYVLQTPGTDTPQLARGVSVHAGVEYMLRSKMAGSHKVSNLVNMAKDVAAKTFDDKSATVPEWGDTPADKVKDSTVNLIEVYAKYALPKINPVSVEKGFAKKVGDVPMIGWIDLVDEQPAISVPGMSEEELELAPKRRVTVDLKTGTARWSKNELDKDPQLTLYAMVEGTPDVRIDQLLIQKNVTFVPSESTRTPEHGAVYTDHLNEVADYVKKGIFPKTPIDNWACNEAKCSYYSMCRGKKK